LGLEEAGLKSLKSAAHLLEKTNCVARRDSTSFEAAGIRKSAQPGYLESFFQQGHPSIGLGRDSGLEILLDPCGGRPEGIPEPVEVPNVFECRHESRRLPLEILPIGACEQLLRFQVVKVMLTGKLRGRLLDETVLVLRVGMPVLKRCLNGVRHDLGQEVVLYLLEWYDQLEPAQAIKPGAFRRL